MTEGGWARAIATARPGGRKVTPPARTDPATGRRRDSAPQVRRVAGNPDKTTNEGGVPQYGPTREGGWRGATQPDHRSHGWTEKAHSRPDQSTGLLTQLSTQVSARREGAELTGKLTRLSTLRSAGRGGGRQGSAAQLSTLSQQLDKRSHGLGRKVPNQG